MKYFIIASLLLLIQFDYAKAHESKKVSIIAETYEVKIPADSDKAEALLKTLSEYDLLGINRGKGHADVQMDEKDVKLLVEAGYLVQKKTGRLKANSSDLRLYTNPESAARKLGELAKLYPTYSRIEDFGKTLEQRQMLGLMIASQPEDVTRPVVILNAMHHAREVMTTEVVLYAAERILQEAATQPGSEAADWLKRFRIFLIPQMNPDGNNQVHQMGRALWRKNTAVIGGNLTGVDINRNYPAHWGECGGSSHSPWAQDFRGPSAGSEPETQSIMALFRKYRPIANISYHAYSELIIFPYGCKGTANPDRARFESMGQAMNQAIENDEGKVGEYAVGTAPEVIYSASGTDNDWHYQEIGTLSYTIEVNSSDQGFQPDFKPWRGLTVRRQEGGWRSLMRSLVSNQVQVRVMGSEIIASSATESSLRYEWFQKDAGSEKLIPVSGVHSGRGLPVPTHGQIAEVLPPGNYELRVFNALGKERRVAVKSTGKPDPFPQTLFF